MNLEHEHDNSQYLNQFMIAIIFFGEHNLTKFSSNLKDPPKIVTADVTFQIFNNLKLTLFSCKFLFIKMQLRLVVAKVPSYVKGARV